MAETSMNSIPDEARVSSPDSSGTQGGSLDGVRVVSLDVRWGVGAQTALGDRIAVAGIPLVRDRLESRDHVVFSGQPATPDETTRLGSAEGVIEVDLAATPPSVERVQIVVFVQPRANAARRTLDELSSLDVSVRDDASGREVTRSRDLSASAGPVGALVVAEVRRDADGWHVSFPARGYEAGLDAVLQQAGARL